MAALRGMHVSPANYSYPLLSRKCDYQADRRTDRPGQCDPYMPLCFAGDTKRVFELFNSTISKFLKQNALLQHPEGQNV